MSGFTWVEYTAEEQAAHAADPREIEWRAYQRRSASNARLHCGCGRFAKALRNDSYFNGEFTIHYTTYRCSRCGEGRQEWE